MNQQPAHQQFSSNQASTSVDDHNAFTNGSMSQRELIPLPDDPLTSDYHIAYQVKKSLLQDKLVSCINEKPYVFTNALVTLRELTSVLFNNMPVQLFQQIISALGIELYRGNK